MNLLLISGSTREGSKNKSLLTYLGQNFDNVKSKSADLSKLKMFHVDLEEDEAIHSFKEMVQISDVVLVSTPEYIHNIPAVLKNAFEWLTKSGEMASKKVIAIVYTPHAPRGEKAMESLMWTLKALDANVLTNVLLHHNDIDFDAAGKLKHNNFETLIEELIKVAQY